MRCFNPTLCYIDRDTSKRRYINWQYATNEIKQSDHLVFNCGKCIICKKRNSLELARRCVLHSSMYLKNCFVTLTYDDQNLGSNKITYADIQKFKKKLRKKYNDKKIEIFNVHEYGKNGRKHWHLVIFNHDFDDKTVFTIKNGNTIYTSKELEQLWPYGYNTIGTVTEASAMYQAQYTQKDLKNGNLSNDKTAKSNHSGIGKPFFLKHYKQILKLGFIPFGDQKMPLPRYFEKLAHKHWSHFNDPTNFFPTMFRKNGLYTPFKIGQENKEISDLYEIYIKTKKEKIHVLEEQWQKVIDDEFTTGAVPDFRKTAENALYELNKKLTKEIF